MIDIQHKNDTFVPHNFLVKYETDKELAACNMHNCGCFILWNLFMSHSKGDYNNGLFYICENKKPILKISTSTVSRYNVGRCEVRDNEETLAQFCFIVQVIILREEN